jgi:adenylyltransferase/sulfurtransferase
MIERLSPRDVDHIRRAGQPHLLIDVREPAEAAIAQLSESQLIPMSELALRLGEIQLQPGQKVILMCHHGVRSLRCAMFLVQNGFEQVANLDGGIDAWSLQVDPTVPRY